MYAFVGKLGTETVLVDQRRLSTIAIQRTFIFSPTVAARCFFPRLGRYFRVVPLHERADIFSAAVTHFDIVFVERFF